MSEFTNEKHNTILIKNVYINGIMMQEVKKTTTLSSFVYRLKTHLLNK